MAEMLIKPAPLSRASLSATMLRAESFVSMSGRTDLASLAGCPSEILRSILGNIDSPAVEMLRLATTCRRWSSICVELAYSRCDVSGRRALLALFCRVTGTNPPPIRDVLTIRGVGDCQLDQVRVEDSHFITPCCHSLHTLNLILTPSWTYLPSANVQRLPNIRHFSLELAKRATATYTNSTRMVAWWLCVVPGATSMSLTGCQWLNHIADDYAIPQFKLNKLEMKQCAGERSDLFLRLLNGGSLETLVIDDTAMPALLSSFAPNVQHLVYSDERGIIGKRAPSRTLELLIHQWKQLKSVILPINCFNGWTLASRSVTRVELRGPPVSPYFLDVRRFSALLDNLDSLRELVLPPALSDPNPLARLLLPLSLQQPDLQAAHGSTATIVREHTQAMQSVLARKEMNASMIAFARDMSLKGIAVDYNFRTS